MALQDPASIQQEEKKKKSRLDLLLLLLTLVFVISLGALLILRSGMDIPLPGTAATGQSLDHNLIQMGGSAIDPDDADPGSGEGAGHTPPSTDDPWHPGGGGKPDGPGDTSTPGGTGQPSDPDVPDEPTDPDTPEEPDQPTEPDEPDIPVKPGGSDDDDDEDAPEIRLELDAAGGDQVNHQFHCVNSLPGDSWSRRYRLVLSHKEPVRLAFQMNVTDQTLALADVMNVAVTYATTGDVLYTGKLSDLDGSTHTVTVQRPRGGSSVLDYQVDISIPTSAGNEYMQARLDAELVWFVE